MPSTSYFAERALLPQGWARDVLFEVDGDGALAAVTPDTEAGAAERLAGPVLPGMPNVHSHAFQRAMAGLAERAGSAEDSFWTWREVMYGFVRRLQPDHLAAIAAQLYVEMLKAGYTAVGEFHYVHHDPEGRPYDDPAEMSRAIFAAAERSGIGLTHLPVLYGYSDFGGAAAREGQRRFLNDPGAFLRIVESAMAAARGNPQVAVGIAPHSLRAVTEATLAEAVGGFARLGGGGPIHIHIAEQQKEVHDCIAWCGERPVEWLLRAAHPDARWCLVHATHITDEEARRLAESGAIVGLCPTTEANLGDGIFPAPAFLAAGGRFGIGSDSHISVSPIEELRWLEYGQRLILRQRNVLAGAADGRSVGARLFKAAVAGGAQALGRPIGRLESGARADFLVLDQESPALAGKDGDLLLDALVFAGNLNPVRDVMVGGRWVIRDGRHDAEAAVADAYRATLRDLHP